ncbi:MULTISPECIES: DUF2116 family Zn-ribbon domain-containing protein [unclassified Methanopyrus]|uniref:DUF2116 family Zn-ribbon domain-containing protein n=1 Tax=unclassified Methanopyrus TaxID=2684913 RepID=UPI000B4B9193|nr:DUF2116 family Zn-ribbon domain-containing protein [Methanopyrus sp. SNP6]
MAEHVPPHSHCIVCGAAIPEGERFCSEKCRREYERRRKRAATIQWVIAGILIALGVVLMLRGV